MPEVTPGCIIEYKYTISSPFILTENYWTVQHDLYTAKEDFRMKPYEGLLEDFTGGYQVSAMYSHMPKGPSPCLSRWCNATAGACLGPVRVFVCREGLTGRFLR